MKTCLVLALASMVILPGWGQEKPVPSSVPVSSVSKVTAEEKLEIRELQLELKDLQLQIQDLISKATDAQNRIRQRVATLQDAHRCKDCQLDARLDWVVPQPKAQAGGGGK